MITAELLERTGSPKYARQLARRVPARPATSKSLHARCSTLGIIAHDSGDRASAVEHLNDALRIAESDGAFTRSLGSTADSSWFSPTVPLRILANHLRDLRRAVVRLGDTALTVLLHLVVGENEGRRGALESASRHIGVASALLKEHHNDWLEGLAEIDASCLAYMFADPIEARARAERAIVCVSRSGHSKSYVAAISNLAHIDLAQSRLVDAQQNLTRALGLSEFNVHAQIAILDGLAQLEIAKGQYCQALDLLEQAMDTPPNRLSYRQLWTQRTRVRLSLLLEDPAGALLCATEGLARATTAGDRALVKLLNLLRAEARNRPGGSCGGRRGHRAGGNRRRAALEILAEIDRVVGKALVREGDQAGAGRRSSGVHAFSTGLATCAHSGRSRLCRLARTQPPRRGS